MKDSNAGRPITGYGNTGSMNTWGGNTEHLGPCVWNSGSDNTGDRNTGNKNTGDLNTGNRNSGGGNSGNNNTGHRNTGDWNTGKRNTGNLNAGYGNAGHRNTGDWNAGYGNVGDGNTGNWNTGNWNTGGGNSGHWNAGDGNTGDWNTGDNNTGFFCTETPAVMFFDRPTSLTREQAREVIPRIDLPTGTEWVASEDMSDDEKQDNPNHEVVGGFRREHELPYTESFPLAWAKMTPEEKQKWLDLPNFDAEKFLEITGVDVRKTTRTIVIDGKTVEISEESYNNLKSALFQNQYGGSEVNENLDN